MTRQSLGLDNFNLALVATVIVATLLPARGVAADFFELATGFAIALLFFLHGAKLPRDAIIAGIAHWRLHLTIFGVTFVAFPLMGWGLKPLLSPLVTDELYLGVLYTCALPATVQSAIAFTSIARGNVAGAICSASASSLIGIFVTPLLVGLLLDRQAGGGDTLQAVIKIVEMLLLPFVAGQLARGRIGAWVDRNKDVLKFVDQGSILLVVYVAFSASVLQGLWREVPAAALVGVLVVSAVLLALALLITRQLARWQGFSIEDQITTVFCGSKKSLASGVPMAEVLFAGHAVGVILLPLMIFHQLQLMVCAVLAQKYAARTATGSGQ